MEFDHFSPEYAKDHLAILADLRERCPIAHSSLYDGFYVITRYDDVATVIRDDETFSSEWREDGSRTGVHIPPFPERHSFLEMDPPESTKYRRALLPLFSPASVKARNVRRQEIVRVAIDEVIESGRFDLVVEYTDRIPAMTTLDLLGLPDDKWREVIGFFHHYTSAPAGASVDPQWLMSYIRAQIKERRESPRDDGLSWILDQKLGDTAISDEEVTESVWLIMAGGFDTTSALLSNTLLYLSENPSDRDRLISNPELLPSACEEFLRVVSPVVSLARSVTRECTLSSQTFQENDRLLVSWAAANHDPAQFSSPDEVILDRFPNRHQAFGLGAHRCIGSTVARENFVAAVGEVLRRIPDYRVIKEESIRYPAIPNNNGWLSMPIEFTPGHRLT